MNDRSFNWAAAGANDKDLIRLLRWLCKCDTVRGVLIKLMPRDSILDEIEFMRNPFYDQGMY